MYLDTSALVKLYIRESGSEQVRDLVDEATIVSTSVVAYPEAMAAFARAKGEERISSQQLNSLIGQLADEWSRFFQIKTQPGLIERAGNLAVNHQLRGFDSIHLASALVLQSAGIKVKFGCFDERLNRSAKTVSLEAVPDLSKGS